MKLKEILGKKYNLSLWIILLLIAMPFILFGGKETVEVERIIETERIVEKPVERVITKEASCDKEQKIIKLYSEILELDNEVFLLTGDFMGELDYWLLNPIKGEREIKTLTNKVNKVAEEKQVKLLEIIILEN